jgi:hypothetical protein
MSVNSGEIKYGAYRRELAEYPQVTDAVDKVGGLTGFVVLKAARPWG